MKVGEGRVSPIRPNHVVCTEALQPLKSVTLAPFTPRTESVVAGVEPAHSRSVPPSAAVPAAAKQQNEKYNDEKCGGIHAVRLPLPRMLGMQRIAWKLRLIGNVLGIVRFRP